jgi:hypothetical protein
MDTYSQVGLGVGRPVGAMAVLRARSSSGDFTQGTIAIEIQDCVPQPDDLVRVKLWIRHCALGKQELHRRNMYMITNGSGNYCKPMAEKGDAVLIKARWQDRLITHDFCAYNKPEHIALYLKDGYFCLSHGRVFLKA